MQRLLLVAMTLMGIVFLGVIEYSTPSTLAVAPVYALPNLLATATRTPTPINVGNFVWDDIDHDGRQDAGEPGL